jgi:hypothetical protein
LPSDTSRIFHFDPGARLQQVDDPVLGTTTPVPLHSRLDELADLVFEAGYDRPAKARLVAALLLDAPADPNKLAAILAKYSRARVRDAVIGTPRLQRGRMVFQTAKRGPRPKRRKT